MEPPHRAADGGSSRLSYREREPHPALADDIACIWSGAATRGMRILPDGCIDIVWIGDELLTVAGPDTAGNVVGLSDGTLTVGIRFRTGRAPGFLGVRADELTDRSIDLDDLWGRDAAIIAEQLAAASTVEAKEAILEEAVLFRMASARPLHPDVDAAVDVIAAAPSQARVGELSRDLNISERQLRRRFDEAVGYGPKTLGRVLRFRHFLSLVEDGHMPIAQAAAEAGYADQSHLTRECNELAGLPPAELVAVRNVQDGA
ncbi:MAG TPA: helix-turn-helix domain-containing protein [Acidimicrobiales bacterium]|nr:helix-turn-helix domain-containing protein [Acidimicrobiales bacterium]